MAGDDDSNISFKLDLDGEEFKAGVLAAQKVLKDFGEGGEGMVKGLGEAFHAALPEIALLTTAFLAVKAAMSTAFSAENIKSINQQFDVLAQQAGVAGDALKRGLVDASKGLIDDTDLTKAANKAMVEFGDNSARLPELMELARKSAVVFGGDTLSKFEELSQAIASGNQRGLKHAGIILDLKKVYKDYADSIGVAVDELSEQGKQTAVLNAAIEKGKQVFSGIDESIKENTNTWQQFKVTISAVIETLTLAFNKIIGPLVTPFLKTLKAGAEEVSDTLKVLLGTTSEQNEVFAKNTKKHIGELEQTIADFEKNGRAFYQGAWIEKGTQLGQQKIDEARAQLSRFKAEVDKETKALGGGATNMPADKKEKIDLDKRKANRAKFEQEMLKLRTEMHKMELKDMDTEVEYDKAANDEKLMAKQEYAAKVKQIQSSESMNETQKNELIAKEAEALDEKLAQIDQDNIARKIKLAEQRMQMTDDEALQEEMVKRQVALTDQQYDEERKAILAQDDLDEETRQQMLQANTEMHQNALNSIYDKYSRDRYAILDRETAHAKGAANQFATGFANASKKAALDLQNFGKQGAQVSGMLTQNMGNMFVQLGEGSEKGSKVMRKALLNMIADVAQYYGMMMLSASLFPPNPALMAAGAALLMLSGLVRAAAGAGGGGAAASAGGGGGSAEAAGGANVGSTQTDQVAEQSKQQQKSVTVNVAGSYFETEQTKTRLTEIVRDSLDATDFSVRKLGTT